MGAPVIAASVHSKVDLYKVKNTNFEILQTAAASLALWLSRLKEHALHNVLCVGSGGERQTPNLVLAPKKEDNQKIAAVAVDLGLFPEPRKIWKRLETLQGSYGRGESDHLSSSKDSQGVSTTADILVYRRSPANSAR